MQFNKIIYQRLYNIACFIPEITANDAWEQQKEISWSMLFAGSQSNMNISFKLDLPQHIKVMEVKLFLLCVRTYESLKKVFSEFENSYPFPDSYVDNPIGFYKYIVSQKDLPAQFIEEKSFGMFRGVRTCVRFYCNFFDSYEIYRCFESMVPALKKLTFLKNLKYHLYCNMRCASRFDGGLTASLINFTTCLERYNQCADETPIRENILNDLISEYGELWYNFHSVAINPNALSRREIERRNAISKTKLGKNKYYRQQVETHLKIIKSRAGQLSMRKACINYFAEYKSELEKLNIKSYRTLQNRLLSTSPNQLRSKFNNSKYTAPTYLRPFVLSVDKLWVKTK